MPSDAFGSGIGVTFSAGSISMLHTRSDCRQDQLSCFFLRYSLGLGHHASFVKTQGLGSVVLLTFELQHPNSIATGRKTKAK